MDTNIFDATGVIVNAIPVDRTKPVRSDFVRVLYFKHKESHPKMGLVSEKDLTL